MLFKKKVWSSYILLASKPSRSSLLHYIFIFILLFFSLSKNCHSSEKKIPYSGGMMYSLGYINHSSHYDELNGIYNGVRGRLYFNFFHNLRIGVTGGTGKTKYGKYESIFSFNHSCLTLEWSSSLRNIILASGGSIGRFSYYLLHKIDVQNHTITAKEKSNTSLMVSPMISIEYPIKESLKISFIADYPFMQIEDKYHHALRFALGILFVR